MRTECLIPDRHGDVAVLGRNVILRPSLARWLRRIAPPLSRAAAILAVTWAYGCASVDGRGEAPAGWALAFSDEFDRAGPPDPALWTPELGYVRNEEAQYYTARRANLRVENGTLVIEAHREAYQGFAFTSASVATIDRRQFRYGRVEVRAKLPRGRGTWPAIWLLGGDIGEVGWPQSGEIDVMEHVGHEPGRIYGTVHTPAFNHTLGTSKGGSIKLPEPWKAFHTYAVEWSAERIEFFVDEQRYFSFAKQADDPAVWPFDKPFYLILNLAIGGAWGGERGIDEAAFPQRFLVDYVRVYRRSADPPAPGAALKLPVRPSDDA
jgi:beta-glucanase (GH16 family)